MKQTEIKAALERGQKVYWQTRAYTVYLSKSGDLMIKHENGNIQYAESEKEDTFFTKSSLSYRTYRGESFPIVGVKYDDEYYAWVSTERFEEIINHDLKCPVEDIRVGAQRLDASTTFCVPADILYDTDEVMLAYLNKNFDEFTFNSTFTEKRH